MNANKKRFFFCFYHQILILSQRACHRHITPTPTISYHTNTNNFISHQHQQFHIISTIISGATSNNFISHQQQFQLSTFVFQTVEASPRRHDDFHSTSSGTGDSGHGSDEDVSYSLEHAGTPVLLLEIPGSFDSSPARPDMGGSGPARSHHSIQSPSAARDPPPSISNNSVKFEPRVVHFHPGRSLQGPVSGQFADRSGSSSSADSKNSTMSSVFSPGKPSSLALRQDHTKHDRPFQHLPSQQHHLPYVTQHQDRPRPSLQHLHPRGQVSFLPEPAQGDYISDDSDLNTTTSGSYSVASDDVTSLAELHVTDMYV